MHALTPTPFAVAATCVMAIAHFLLVLAAPASTTVPPSASIDTDVQFVHLYVEADYKETPHLVALVNSVVSASAAMGPNLKLFVYPCDLMDFSHILTAVNNTTSSRLPPIVVLFNDDGNTIVNAVRNALPKLLLSSSMLAPRIFLYCFDYATCQEGDSDSFYARFPFIERLVYLDPLEFLYITARVATLSVRPFTTPVTTVLRRFTDLRTHRRDTVSLAISHNRYVSPTCCSSSIRFRRTLKASWTSDVVNVSRSTCLPSDEVCIDANALSFRVAASSSSSVVYSVRMGSNDTRSGLLSGLMWNGPDITLRCWPLLVTAWNATLNKPLAVPRRCLSLSPSFPGTVTQQNATQNNLTELERGMLIEEVSALAVVRNPGMLWSENITTPPSQSSPYHYSVVEAVRAGASTGMLRPLLTTYQDSPFIHDWASGMTTSLVVNSSFAELVEGNAKGRPFFAEANRVYGAGVASTVDPATRTPVFMSCFGRFAGTDEFSSDMWLRSVGLNDVTTERVHIANSSPIPPLRYGHSLTAVNSSLFLLHGGTAVDGTILNDFWLFNSATSSWSQVKLSNDASSNAASYPADMSISSSPARRSGHRTATYTGVSLTINGITSTTWFFFAFGLDPSNEVLTGTNAITAVAFSSSDDAIWQSTHIMVPSQMLRFFNNRTHACFAVAGTRLVIAGGTIISGDTAMRQPISTIVYSFQDHSWVVASARTSQSNTVAQCFFAPALNRLVYLSAALVTTRGNIGIIPVHSTSDFVISGNLTSLLINISTQWIGDFLRCPTLQVVAKSGLECEFCGPATNYLDGQCFGCGGQYCGDRTVVIGITGATLLLALGLVVTSVVWQSYARAVRSENAEKEAFSIAYVLAQGFVWDPKSSCPTASINVAPESSAAPGTRGTSLHNQKTRTETRLQKSIANIFAVFLLYSKFLPQWVFDQNASLRLHQAGQQNNASSTNTAGDPFNPSNSWSSLHRGSARAKMKDPLIKQQSLKPAATKAKADDDDDEDDEDDDKSKEDDIPIPEKARLVCLPEQTAVFTTTVTIADIRFRHDFQSPGSQSFPQQQLNTPTSPLNAVSTEKQLLNYYGDIALEFDKYVRALNATLLSLLGDRAFVGFGVFAATRNGTFEASCLALALCNSTRVNVASVGIGTSDAVVGLVGELFGRRLVVTGQCLAVASKLASTPLSAKKSIATLFNHVKSTRALSVRCVGLMRVPPGDTVPIAEVRGVRSGRNEDNDIVKSIESRLGGDTKLHRSTKDYRMWNTVCDYIDKGQLSTAKKVLEGATVATENRGELEQYIERGSLPPVLAFGRS